MFVILSLLLHSLSIAHSAKSFETQELGVYYNGNVSTEYLSGTIIIPGTPVPTMRDQLVYYYFAVAKENLSAGVIVVFCGDKDGCFDSTIGPGYYAYAELSNEGRVAGGEKIPISPGEAAQVTVIQSGTFLSVNVTKLSDGKDSYFDIYGANGDGGLTAVVAGVVLQYPKGQLNLCEDYATESFVISNIVAVQTGGTNVNNLAFQQEANANNTCKGTVEVGTNGKYLQIFGTK